MAHSSVFHFLANQYRDAVSGVKYDGTTVKIWKQPVNRYIYKENVVDIQTEIERYTHKNAQ